MEEEYFFLKKKVDEGQKRYNERKNMIIDEYHEKRLTIIAKCLS